MDGQGITSAGDSLSLTASSPAVANVKRFIADKHSDAVSWYITLNNHASTRPKDYGGPLVRSAKDAMTFTQLGPRWQCTLCLPNSFEPNDGLEVRAIGEGGTKDSASEEACHTSVRHSVGWQRVARGLAPDALKLLGE